MGLYVEYSDYQDYDGFYVPASWTVCQQTDSSEDLVVASGFARQHDAEIALRVMIEQTDIDWEAPTDDEAEYAKWIALGRFAGAMRLICEHLQW